MLRLCLGKAFVGITREQLLNSLSMQQTFTTVM